MRKRLTWAQKKERAKVYWQTHKEEVKKKQRYFPELMRVPYIPLDAKPVKSSKQ